MTIHRISAAAALVLMIGTAEAGGLKPIEAQRIDLGAVSGIAYYTVEPDGFHVVATLAPGDADGTPIRIQSVLASGQSVTLSTPGGVDVAPQMISIGRRGDELVVQGNLDSD